MNRSIPSPLHGLSPVEPPLLDSPAPVQEQPPAAAPIPAYASPAMIPHTVQFRDEVV
jgi:hypothetical protein